MQKIKEMLQWHPAFYAGLQIELQEEAERFAFENEHQLGTKPKIIDVLVIKKEEHYQVQKNIGRIFRTHNIIEYKSPLDSLGVNDFYRTYGYACFYKADTAKEDRIPITEITITFVSSQYPRVLLRHLETVRSYTVREVEEGIYYIEGDIMPIQLIVTAKLSFYKNLWLKSLTNKLERMEDARELVSEYKNYKENTLYQSVMEMIVRANREKFQEVKEMCSALEELMKDEMDALREKSISEGLAEGRAKGLAEGRAKGLVEGRAEGQELNLISLIQRKIKKNKPLEVVASELEAGLDGIRDIYEMVRNNPAAEEEEIYQLLHLAK